MGCGLPVHLAVMGLLPSHLQPCVELVVVRRERERGRERAEGRRGKRDETRGTR
jgi:hypothetical protein